MAEVKEKILYELYILLEPTAVDADISNIESTIKQILEKGGAQIDRSEKFIKKNLAYSIKGFNYAYCASIYFLAMPQTLKEMQAELKLSEIPFLRLMLSKKITNKAPKRKALRKPKINEEKLDEVLTLVEKRADSNIPKIKEETEKDKSVTLEEIDKRLDEIMENL